MNQMNKLNKTIRKLIGQPIARYYNPKKHFLSPHHSNYITQGGIYRYSFRESIMETAEAIAAKHREINRPGRINALYGSMGSRDLIMHRSSLSQIQINSLKHMVP